jgi:2-amino-4-hydroxy-6-hydroxymethyldihydropteridine diphosphokinase
MHQVVLLIGGNLGNREKLLKMALESLEEEFVIKVKSRLYETAPWGGNSAGPYLNQAVLVETDKTPEQVLAIGQAIEEQLDRKREKHWGDRTMDIDIIYFDDLVMETPLLTIPHPFLHQRRFVLVPVSEIVPSFLHPVMGKSQVELLQSCADRGEVRLYGQ